MGELRGLQMSFWGIFGWFSILLPSWAYTLFALLTALALSGAVITWLRSRKASRGSNAEEELVVNAFKISWVWVLISLALMAYWISVAQGSHGRLLFPAVGALAVAAVGGLRYWAGLLPRIVRVALGPVVPLGLWSCSLYALGVLLPDAYGLDTMADVVSEVPADAISVGNVYGDGIELVAARPPDPDSFSGDSVPVTLHFRAAKVQDQDHELFLHLLDANDRQIGNVTTPQSIRSFPCLYRRNSLPANMNCVWFCTTPRPWRLLYRTVLGSPSCYSQGSSWTRGEH